MTNLSPRRGGPTTRPPAAFQLVPFMCERSGGSFGGVNGSQIAEGGFALGQSLFGIPFLLARVIFWSIAREGARRRNFGAGLAEHRLHFLLQTLKQYLGAES